VRKFIVLTTLVGAGLLVGNAYAYNCTSVAQYVNGSSYATGAIVKNVNHACQHTVGGCTAGDSPSSVQNKMTS
jgi:chitinase